MQILPKANPLKENLPASRHVVSSVLRKLAEESFTGYVNFNSNGFNTFCIFDQGNMVSVSSFDNAVCTSGFEAFEMMLDRVYSEEGELNIYRMTPDLVMCAHALLHGEKLYTDEVIRQIDMKTIFAELKSRGLNGVVRFMADDRVAMLFFKGGNPLGFYTNGSKSIDTSPEESRKIAALAGARLDVFSINPQEDIIPYDLLHMFDMESIWEQIASRRNPPAEKPEPPSQPPAAVPDTTPAAEAAPPPQAASVVPAEPEDDQHDIDVLLEDLRDVAIAYLSKTGAAVIDRQLENLGGPAMFHSIEQTDRFLGMVLMDALKIDDHANIEEMIQLMRSEIENRIHNRR